MKTAREIADGIIGSLDFGDGIVADEYALSDAFKSGWFEGGDAVFMIERGVEAGIEMGLAEPRDELSVTLPSGQEIRVWIGTSDSDGSALVQIDTGGTEGNVRVYVNDANDPILDENPETGHYENMRDQEGVEE